MADKIVVLGKDGTVAEEGSYRDLVNLGGYVSSIYEAGKRDADDTATTASVLSGDKTANDEKVAREVKKSDSTDKRRQLGDNTVYRFYFSSLGPVFMALLLAVEFTNAFLQVFPSTYTLQKLTLSD